MAAPMCDTSTGVGGGTTHRGRACGARGDGGNKEEGLGESEQSNVICTVLSKSEQSNVTCTVLKCSPKVPGLLKCPDVFAHSSSSINLLCNCPVLALHCIRGD